MLCFSLSEKRRLPARKIGRRIATFGHMEQLDQPVYRFDGFARRENGTIEPISIAIFAPKDSGKGDSVCLLCCPFLRAKPFSIHGVDHDQALELSRRYIEWDLGYMNACLVDADGEPVELPPVPKASELRQENPT